MLPSKRLLASYFADWLTVIILVAVGGSLSFVQTSGRPFSVLDVNISYPLIAESITVGTLALVALLAPAVIVLIVTVLLLPARTISRTLKRSELLRLKLWELHAGLAGLALSVALAFFITQGLKTIFAKPRPHFLAVCDPDLQNLAAHVVGGYGQDISVRWTLVDTSICSQPQRAALNDAFRSFPSGHCSFSWSGLLYLSLFLAAKFAIAIPYLDPNRRGVHNTPNHSHAIELLPLHHSARPPNDSDSKSDILPPAHEPSEATLSLYNQGAAPPVYGILLFLIPLGVAAYISSTRYTEFWHFGFDVISGSVIGIASAWIAFRWHQMPIRRGRGWAWGPRSVGRAFGIRVGTDGYVSSEASHVPAISSSSTAPRPMHLPGSGTLEV